jgi:hypothetical protein
MNQRDLRVRRYYRAASGKPVKLIYRFPNDDLLGIYIPDYGFGVGDDLDREAGGVLIRFSHEGVPIEYYDPRATANPGWVLVKEISEIKSKEDDE